MKINKFWKGWCFLIILLFVGASVVPSIMGDWNRYGYDLNRSNYYPYPSDTELSDDPFQEIWNAVKYTYSRDRKWRGPYSGDVTGDGNLELVYGYTPSAGVGKLVVLDNEGDELWTETINADSWSYGTFYWIDMLADVTGDDALEIFVSRKISNTVGEILVYDGNKNLLKTLRRTIARDGGIHPTAVIDQYDDGHNDVIAYVSSNWAANPRGASLFNYTSGSETWFYAAGKPVANRFDDVNNDGLLEMSGGWSSVHNGARGSGRGGNTTTTDGDCWTVVINENGWEVFSKKWTGYNHHGNVINCFADLNNDGTKEILTIHRHDPYHYPGTADIHLLDATNGAILDQWIGPNNHRYQGWAFADINNDGKDEIIIAHTDGVVRVIDYNLNVIDSVTYSSNVRVHAVNDLNGDGDLEVIIGTGSTLRVLNKNLNELWSYSFPANCDLVILSDLDDDGINEIIVASDKLYVLATEEESVEKKALLIGCWDYSNNENDEIAFKNDYYLIKCLLEYGLNFDVKTCENPSSLTILDNSIKSFLDESKETDKKFLYYAGHGGRHKDGDFINEFITDSSANYYYDSTLGLRLSDIKNLGAIFQCCNAGGLSHIFDGTEDKKYHNFNYNGIYKDSKVIGMAAGHDEKATAYWNIFTFLKQSVFTKNFIYAFTHFQNIAKILLPGDNLRVSLEEGLLLAKLLTQLDPFASENPEIYDSFEQQFYLSDDFISSFLSFFGHCPIHIHAFNESGNHTGLNIESGKIDNELPGVFYCGSDDNNLLVAFTDKYKKFLKIQIESYDNGYFTLECQDYDDESQSTTTILYDNIPIIETSIAYLIIEDGIFGNMEIDDDGDEVIDRVIPPTVLSSTGFVPFANFIFSPDNPYVFDTVVFNASSSYDIDGNIVEYLWDFGDGNKYYGELIEYAFLKTGTHKVTLTVTDNDGLSDITQQIVEVDHKYGLWANSTEQEKAIEWSGSTTSINGHIHSNDGILISGSDNTINGVIYYANLLEFGGDKIIYTSTEQISPKQYPINYNISDYQPGGIEATTAQNEGKYHYIDDDFEISDSNKELDGLYYVTGTVKLSGEEILGTFTIVAKDNIEISGSKHNYNSYCNDLIFLSNGELFKISGSENSQAGITYVPNGEIEISGSKNIVMGSFFGDTVKLPGSELTITAN
jgi:hypothetical protein